MQLGHMHPDCSRRGPVGGGVGSASRYRSRVGGRPLIRAAARWEKLDEATVTIECQASDAAAAAEAARAIIRRIAGFTGQIGVRDIEVARVASAG
jgi:hypothetical protein